MPYLTADALKVVELKPGTSDSAIPQGIRYLHAIGID